MLNSLLESGYKVLWLRYAHFKQGTALFEISHLRAEALWCAGTPHASELYSSTLTLWTDSY